MVEHKTETPPQIIRPRIRKCLWHRERLCQSWSPLFVPEQSAEHRTRNNVVRQFLWHIAQNSNWGHSASFKLYVLLLLLLLVVRSLFLAVCSSLVRKRCERRKRCRWLSLSPPLPLCIRVKEAAECGRWQPAVLPHPGCSSRADSRRLWPFSVGALQTYILVGSWPSGTGQAAGQHLGATTWVELHHSFF